MNSIKDTLKKTKPGAGDNGRWKYLALCTAEEDEKELLNSDIGCSPMGLFGQSWFRQTVASLAASTSMFVKGTNIALSGVMTSKIRNVEQDLGADDEDVSWIGAAIPIGAIFGSLCGGLLMDKLGRKRSMFLVGMINLLGFATTAMAGSITGVIIGRFISGFSAGASPLIGSVYIAEVSEPKRRGRMGTLFVLGLALGITYTFMLGVVLPWRTLLWLCAGPQIVGLLVLLAMPESPYHLMHIGQEANALKAVSWLHGGNHETTMAAMEDIRGFVPSKATEAEIVPNAQHGSLVDEEEGQKYLSDMESKPHQSKQQMEMVANIQEESGSAPHIVRIQLIIYGCIALVRACGVSSITYYLVDILKYCRIEVDPFVAAAGVGMVELMGTILSFMIFDKLGRKVLLALSGAGMALAHMIMILHLQLAVKDHRSFESVMANFTMASKGDPMVISGGVSNHSSFIFTTSSGEPASPSMTIVPLMGLILFYVSFAIGGGPVPAVLTGEVFPHKVKVYALPISHVCMWLVALATAKSFFWSTNLVGLGGTFGIYMVCSVLIIIYTLLFLPETRNKTFVQIQEELRTGRTRPKAMEPA